MAKGIYTPDEVVTQYRQAKDKKEQIHILAELQNCSESEIVERLRSRGVEVGGALDGFEVVPMKEPKKHWGPIEEGGALAGKACRKKSVPWTSDEVERLCSYAAEGLTIAEACERLGRPYGSVSSKAHDLRVSFGAERFRRAMDALGENVPEDRKKEAKAEGEKPPQSAVPTAPPEGEPEKPIEIEKPKVVLSPTRALSFDDRIEAVRFLSALFGAAPLDCRIEGELITLKFPRGMCMLHACRWDEPKVAPGGEAE